MANKAASGWVGVAQNFARNALAEISLNHWEICGFTSTVPVLKLARKSRPPSKHSSSHNLPTNEIRNALVH